MKKCFFTCLMSVLFLFSYASKAQNSVCNDEKVIGVKIYEYKGEVSALVKNWKDVGINTVFASKELLSQDEIKKLTKQNGIKTFVILPIFFDPEALSADSSLYAITKLGEKAKEEWVEFVCPSSSSFKEKKIESIKDFVKTHNPDGISIDFIRHFVFWEKVYPEKTYESLPNTCFDEKCITEFCKSISINYPDNLGYGTEAYDWVKTNYFNQWVEWKCGLITETVKRIVEEVKKIKPNVLVNLHIVPWRQNDFNGAIKIVVGQDVKELAKYTDYLSPMTYSHMVRREPEWVHSVVDDLYKSSEANILPSIQVGTAYRKETFSADEFSKCLNEALKEPSCGVVFWNWDALSKQKEKLEIVKEKLKK